MQSVTLAPKACIDNDQRPAAVCVLQHTDLNLLLMSNLFTISLHNVRFRAYHGLYPEERQKGNDFVVNMDVSYAAGTEIMTTLDNTIDYAALFTIIHDTMQQPVGLLETLVQQIAVTVTRQYPQVLEVAVSVEKLNPPIDRFEGSAAVKYTWKK